MTYSVFLSRRFERDIEDFFDYASAYSEAFSREQFTRLRRVIEIELATTPRVWATFFLTGEPYRAYLFRVGQRTSYWIVFRIAEERHRIDLMRFWNASRQPSSFRAR